MPTEFWYPISGATHDMPPARDAWTLGAGANKNVATRPGGGRLGPMTHDDISTYITYNAVGYQAANTDWPGPMAQLGSVFTAAIRHVTGGGSTNRGGIFANAAGTLGSSAYVNVTDASASWASSSLVDVSSGPTYRPGGGAWVVADFANDKTQFVTAWVATGQAYVTSLWGQIEYTPPVGGYVFLLGLAGLCALPFVGRITDFAQFQRYLEWRAVFHPRRTKWADGEMVRAWLDVKAYRWPTYFEVAA